MESGRRSAPHIQGLPSPPTLMLGKGRSSGRQSAERITGFRPKAFRKLRLQEVGCPKEGQIFEGVEYRVQRQNGIRLTMRYSNRFPRFSIRKAAMFPGCVLGGSNSCSRASQAPTASPEAIASFHGAQTANPSCVYGGNLSASLQLGVPVRTMQLLSLGRNGPLPHGQTFPTLAHDKPDWGMRSRQSAPNLLR